MADWYVIHTLSGSEKRLKQMILDQASKKGMSHLFEEILIPVVEESEIKRGKIVKVEKKFMPGYLLIKMDMNDNAWHLVKSIPKIGDFLGAKSHPIKLSEKEIKNILDQIEIQSKGAGASKLYNIGEQVNIIDGPFDSFSGVVEEVDNINKRLRVAVLIFGKPTVIDLGFTQVKKN